MPIIKDDKLRQNNYWHPIKGAPQRWKSSWENGTNPVKVVFDSGLASFMPGINVIQALYSAKQSYDNLASNKGIKKTIREAKKGNYSSAIKSGLGDLLDLSGVYGGKLAFNDLQTRGRAALYRNKNPFGYGNNIRSDKTTWQELRDAAGEFFSLKHLDTKGKPKYMTSIKESGDIKKLESASANLNGEARMELRDAAYRKYLRFPERAEHIGVYVDNPDGKTVSYGIDKVNKIRRKYKSADVPENFNFEVKNKNGAHSDFITTNGGNVDRVVAPDGSVYMVDIWDINPLQDSRRSIAPFITKHVPWLKNIEAGTIIGSKPFTLKHKIK